MISEEKVDYLWTKMLASVAEGDLGDAEIKARQMYPDIGPISKEGADQLALSAESIPVMEITAILYYRILSPEAKARLNGYAERSVCLRSAIELGEMFGFRTRTNEMPPATASQTARTAEGATT